MSDIRRFFIGKGGTTAYGLMSVILAFVPEDAFKIGMIPCQWTDTVIVTANRIILFLFIFVIANIIYYIYRGRRSSVTLSDETMTIEIEYGDICSITKGKKVINFDECFTTTVGERPKDVKPDSVCGQYLQKYPLTEDEMQNLIREASVKPVGTSLLGKKEKYAQGILVPREDFLLMAFAKLDKNGLAVFTYDKYLECLDRLWEQIDLYHGTADVYISILGSRITRFDKDLTQQELLDVIITSYRLNPKKLKKPNTLHIVCKKREGFSINNIFGVE